MNNFLKALELFKNKKTGSIKNGPDQVFVVVPNALILKTYKSRYNDPKIETDVLGIHSNTEPIFNSSVIENLNQDSSRRVISPEQTYLSENGFTMIPFSALIQAGLKLTSFKELDKTEPEIIKQKKADNYIKQTGLEKMKLDPKIEIIEIKKSEYSEDSHSVSFFEKRHFNGARLFTCSNNHPSKDPVLVENKTYLLDVDREELKHGIVNPFLVEITGQPKTIKEAYENLKPDVVKQAEKSGLKIERQGEWFFVPVEHSILSPEKNGYLRAGQNRPNTAENFKALENENKVTEFFVQGKISHTGREHRDVILESWHRAIPNTSQNSFSLSGDID